MGIFVQVLKHAFSYHWKLWTILDVTELLRQAGFNAVHVWLRPMKVGAASAPEQQACVLPGSALEQKLNFPGPAVCRRPITRVKMTRRRQTLCLTQQRWLQIRRCCSASARVGQPTWWAWPRPKARALALMVMSCCNLSWSVREPEAAHNSSRHGMRPSRSGWAIHSAQHLKPALLQFSTDLVSLLGLGIWELA